MTVANTGGVDLNSLLKGDDMGNLGGLLGGSGSDNSGGGDILLGLLLGRTLLPGGLAGEAAVADRLTAADVQNIVSANTNSQTLGQVDGEIWKAEGQLQAALAASTNAAQTAVLQSEIANLQGQGVIVKAVTEGAAAIAKQGGEGIAATLAAAGNVVTAVNAGNANLQNSITSTTTSLLATTNALASQAAANAADAAIGTLQAKYDTLLAIGNDGDKTRVAIAALAATLPNSRELDLQRQLAVALEDHRHTQTRGIIDSGNVNVVTNVNQTAVAQAQAVANQQIIGLLGTVASAIQHNTQSTVNLGTMIGSGQTATNVRS